MRRTTQFREDPIDMYDELKRLLSAEEERIQNLWRHL
jgi:hypothetical protein